jgi:disulfide oxidoreductase YuzD
MRNRIVISHSRAREIISSTIIMAINDQPEWDSTDDALKERFMYCPLRMRFISNPINKNEKEADKTFKNKISNDKHYCLAYLTFLITYYH